MAGASGLLLRSLSEVIIAIEDMKFRPVLELLESRLLLSGTVVTLHGEPIENFSEYAEILQFDPAPEREQLESHVSSQLDAPALAAFPLDQTFLLHSNPGASKVIYLDFDGHVTSATEWNNAFTGGADIVSPAYSFEGDSSFSDTEKLRIQNIWKRVTEDFIPFDVDVTTEDPGSAALIRSNSFDTEWGVRMVIGGNSSDWYADGAGGVAYVGSFTWSSDTPGFVFPENLLNNEKYIAEAVTHEAGHTLGLRHDGNDSVEYYAGHGSGATGWAPIMGVGYYEELVQWSRGEYPAANNAEDDLAIIVGNNGFGYRGDDHGGSLAGADALFVDAEGLVFDEGIVERNTDLDFFSFTTMSGAIVLDVDPFGISPNLDILAKLYDSGGGLVASDNPAEALDAGFSLDLAAGTYYLSVEGVGKSPLDTGYSDYGSLGYYSISGRLSGPEAIDAAIASSDISFDIEFPQDSDTVTISAVVNNLGNEGLSGLVVRFYEGDPNFGGVQIGSDFAAPLLGPYASTIAQAAWSPGSSGVIDVYVVLDPDNFISEDDESNNAAYNSIYVSDNDNRPPDIYNVVVSEYNGDGDGVVAADEQTLISWELTDAIARGPLITEVSTGDAAFVEIQNVWDQAIDVSGWTVLLNDADVDSPDINAVNPQAWVMVGHMAAREVAYRSEDPSAGADYFGDSILWENDGPGWAMIVDGDGDVRDFAVWGYSAAEIAAMSVNYGAFAGITAGGQWSGDGAEKGSEPSPPSPPVNGSIVYSGGAYSENFNSMGASGTAAPEGWTVGSYIAAQTNSEPLSAPDDEALQVDDGSSRTQGQSYNYGSNGDSDRAIGNVPRRNSGDRAIQVAITNDTGAEITALNLSYVGEQWRDSRTRASLPQNLSVWFSREPGSGFTSLGDGFSFLAPSNEGLSAAIDGNDPGNRTEISGLYVLDAPVLDGETFYITWHDSDDANEPDHGLAIDNVVIIPEYDPPNSILQRVGDADSDTAADFVRTGESTMGGVNPDLIQSSGIGLVELLVDGSPVTMSGDYYAIVGPLSSGGFAAADHSFTINAGDGDNSPAYSQFVGTVTVSPSEELTILHEGLPVVSGQVDPIDFGRVEKGGPALEELFEIRNDGAQTLSFSAITAPPGFSVAYPRNMELSPGGSTTFTVTFDTDHVGLFGGEMTLATSDGAQSPDGLDESAFTLLLSAEVTAAASISGRYLFYNNSALDGSDPAASPEDDAALAAGKVMLLPGQAVTSANYSSYSRGINGIMVDVDGLGGMPASGDIGVRVYDDQSGSWAPGPAPSVSLRSGDGADGSDRVTLIWPDGAIVNQWVEVKVLSDSNGGGLGLDADDVFYFGNSIGDCDGDGAVGDDDYDLLVSQFGQRGDGLAADLNRDGRVNLHDFAIMRSRFGETTETPTFPAAAPEAPRAASAISVEEQPVNGDDSEYVSDISDDSSALAVLAPVVDLLVGPLSVSGYIPEPPPTFWGGGTPTLHRAATSEYDLRPLNDDAVAGEGDDLLTDILAESALALPL